MTWLVYWTRTVQSVFTGAGLKRLNIRDFFFWKINLMQTRELITIVRLCDVTGLEKNLESKIFFRRNNVSTVGWAICRLSNERILEKLYGPFRWFCSRTYHRWNSFDCIGVGGSSTYVSPWFKAFKQSRIWTRHDQKLSCCRYLQVRACTSMYEYVGVYM